MFEVEEALLIGPIVAVFLFNSGRIRKAIEILKECLVVLEEKAFKEGNELFKLMYEELLFEVFEWYLSFNDFTNAVECGRVLLVLACESGNKDQEGRVYLKLGTLHLLHCKYQEAKTFYEKALGIMIATESILGEGSCYLNLGATLNALGENGKAKDYLLKALAISKNVEARRGEAVCYGNLGNVFASLGEYAKAKENYEKGIAVRQEIGYRENEALCYTGLGNVFISLGQYDKAKEHLEKGLKIAEDSGDRKTQAYCYRDLAGLLNDNAKAKESFEKALAITKEIGDKENETACYCNLGTVLYNLGKLAKSKECTEKALATAKDIGNREIEVSCYGNLGPVLQNLGEYAKAKDYFEKALAIAKEMGDKKSVATSSLSLGILFKRLGDYSKAKEHLTEALRVTKKIGCRNEEALCHGSLGALFCRACEKAQKHYENQLQIAKEIGCRTTEASGYLNLGGCSRDLGDYAKAKEYLEKAVSITEEIADKNGGALCGGILGTVLHFLGDYSKAREYHKKALCMSQEAGNIFVELDVVSEIAMTLVLEGKMKEASSYLLDCIAKFEDVRSSLKDNIESQLKITLFDQHILECRVLSSLFCITGKPVEGLHVAELGRARALADLMSVQYSLKSEVSAFERLWADFEKCMINESNSSFLYISYFANSLFLWLFNGAGELIRFQEVDVNKCLANNAPEVNKPTRLVDDVFETIWFGKFRAEDHQENGQLQPSPTLAECYKMFVEPVADCLDAAEIIIVPDRCLFKVPFTALEDERGKYLSESFRIRIIPSLLTLKLVQDTPADNHNQTGALIVGDPDVGLVRNKRGKKIQPHPLPRAREEAEIIGKLLQVQPLLGEKATKQAVIQSINSVSLIHFACHGDEQLGEIILAPLHPVYSKSGEEKKPREEEIPREEDYILTMADISQVRLQAKLVVLSCCHSASGHVSAEGVVGIAHAFLGSGARSVLVALWAIDDEATKQFMSRFYEHLVRGESASESLHQAMKWMRENGYSKVGQWAPFMLIGDNATLDFRK